MDRRFRAARGQRLVVLEPTTVLLGSLVVFFPPHQGTLSRASASTANSPHTLTGKHCRLCHDADEHEANLALESLDFSRVDADAEVRATAPSPVI
jgi:hypothetical protein